MTEQPTLKENLKLLENNLIIEKKEAEATLERVAKELNAVQVLLNSSHSNGIINNHSSEWGKTEEEGWKEYVIRLLNYLGKAKSTQIVDSIITYNPSITRDQAIKNTKDSLWQLKTQSRVKASGNRAAGYTYSIADENTH